MLLNAWIVVQEKSLSLVHLNVLVVPQENLLQDQLLLVRTVILALFQQLKGL